MHIAFQSGHVDGDYSDGKLHLRVAPDIVQGLAPRVDALWFSVPVDFHTHSDSVAAALMTLVGRRFQDVTFNFSISRYCADTLAWYYQLDEIGPVDESLEPRRPGRFLALNFSGGLDSTAIWVLLRDLAKVTFKVVTSEYEHSRLDHPGYINYQRDVSTQTNLRRLRYDQAGRFNCAAPLLFADYADLWGVASGHEMSHYPGSYESLAHGGTPAFLTQDATYTAGGLVEVHIARGLCEPGLARLLANVAPERIAAALDASAFAGDRKRAMKSLMLRYFFDASGTPLPACLHDIPMPKLGVGRLSALGVSSRVTWMYLRLEPEILAGIEPNMFLTDRSSLDQTSADFYERYHTSYAQLIPGPLRLPVTTGLHAGGIYPYNERDYLDLDVHRRYLEGIGIPTVSPSLRRPTPPPACWSPDAYDPARLEL